ncbi:MAG: hypothetical protein KIH64_014800 [Mycobacterium sp.]|nr:hypothetical protein [Mycobacterium sp.]
MRLVTSLVARAAGAMAGVSWLRWLTLASMAGLGAWGVTAELRARGARADLADLHAAVARADRDAALRSESQGRAALVATEQYAAWRAGQESRHAETRTALRNALSGPISAPGGRVGDVVVGAAAVQRLRDAGDGDAPGGASAAAPGPGR